MSDLKPCPFCGGAARIESNRDWHRLYADHDENCFLGADEADVMYPAKPEYLAMIYEVWNRRTQPEATAPAADPIIQAALQRDHDRAVKAIKRAAEFTPEVDGLTPENAIDLLSFKLCNAAPAQDLSAAILALEHDCTGGVGASYYIAGFNYGKQLAAALASSANALSAGDRVDAEIMKAAMAVVREALDSVSVHPCDQHEDSVRAKGLVEPMAGLYAAILQSQKGGSRG